MYHFHYPILVIKDPELLKQVTIKDFDHFTDHITFLPPDSDSLFSKSLLGLQGELAKLDFPYSTPITKNHPVDTDNI